MSLFTITFESSSHSSDEPAARPPAGKGLTEIVFSDSYSEDDIPVVTKMAPRPAAKPQPEEEYSEYDEYSEEGVKPVVPPPKPKPASPPPQDVAKVVQAGEEDIDEEDRMVNMVRHGTPYKPVSNMQRYSLVRLKKGIRGMLVLTLLKEDKPVLATKVKDRDCIKIGRGAEFHMRSTVPCAILTSSDKSKVFELKRVGEGGEEKLMTMNFSLPDGPKTPRKIDVSLEKPPESVPATASNRMPHLARNNTWVVDLGGRYAMKSRKNCIIVDDKDREIFSVIKADKNRLTVEVRLEFDDIYAFGFGAACFLCKV